MAYSKEAIVPLGRSYDECVEMFASTTTDLTGRILGCADGPTSFNAIHSANGGSVESRDPSYDFSGGQIRYRIEETFPESLRQVRLNQKLTKCMYLQEI